MTVTVMALLSINEDATEDLAAYMRVTQPLLKKVGAGSRQRFTINDVGGGVSGAKSVVVVDYPDRATELAILKARCPNVEARLAEQIIGFVQKLREEDLEKTPGIAEMLDFAAALMGLGIADLTDEPAVLQSTLTTLLKTQSDQACITREVAGRIAGRAA